MQYKLVVSQEQSVLSAFSYVWYMHRRRQLTDLENPSNQSSTAPNYNKNNIVNSDPVPVSNTDSKSDSVFNSGSYSVGSGSDVTITPERANEVNNNNVGIG